MAKGTTAATPTPTQASETARAEPAAPAPEAVSGDGPLERESILFLQRHAGNAAVGRLLRRRSAASVGTAHARLLQRDYYDEGTPGNRPGMDVGDTGPGVTLLQRMIGATETGVFDAETRKAADEFQRQQGWDPSGVGPMTWAAIDGQEGSPGHRPNLVQGNRGPGVRLLQQILGVKVTGYFGTLTRAAVDTFQRAQGWTPSGVGPMTWERLDAKWVADQMGSMANPAAPTRAVWRPSGNNPTRTDFSAWAMAATEAPFDVTPTTYINCWEMVLFAAFKRGSIKWSQIHDIYMYAGPHDWFVELANRLSASATVWDRATHKPKPKRGDVVMFDGAAHVALATGVTDAAGTHIYSFWPPPDIKFLAGGTPDRVKDTTIEALVPVCDAINASSGDPPCVVTVGPPSIW